MTEEGIAGGLRVSKVCRVARSNGYWFRSRGAWLTWDAWVASYLGSAGHHTWGLPPSWREAGGVTLPKV